MEKKEIAKIIKKDVTTLYNWEKKTLNYTKQFMNITFEYQ